MVCSMRTICTLMGVPIVLYVTTLMLSVPNAQPFVFFEASLVEDKWTAQDLGTLARTKNMAAAVGHLLKDVAGRPGAPVVLQVAG